MSACILTILKLDLGIVWWICEACAVARFKVSHIMASLQFDILSLTLS